MARRKTFDVDQLRISVNSRLAGSVCSADVRSGMCSILEEVLHDTGNYRGFGYLTATEVPRGHLPGIIRDGENSVFPDETRRYYNGVRK